MIAASTGPTGIAVILTLYFLPSLIAFGRKVRNTGSVVVINVFLGWTLIGWVVALAMAARSVDRRPPSRSAEMIPTDYGANRPK